MIAVLLLVPGCRSRAGGPGFRLADRDGRTRTAEEFRGRVVLLDFWAPW